MVTLSLCAIVKNEEKTLPQCLDSVRDAVDEMVVVDTGSNDRTIEIARSYGAKVPTFDWTGDFSEARNAALTHVTGDWVLVLDADEALTPRAIPAIKAAIADPKCLAVNLIRHEIGASQSPYSLVSRLFRRHPQVFFQRPYHSLIDDSVLSLIQREPQWQILDLPEIAILHYGYTSEAIAALNKYDRAQQAMEGFLQKHPRDPYTCSKLGAIYLKRGKIERGMQLLKQGLKSGTANPHMRFELHYHLANAYAARQQWEKAARQYQKALDQPILDTLKLGAYNNFGGLLQNLGDFERACQAFEIVLNIDPTFAPAYYNLGLIARAQNQPDRAIAAYQKAIALNPNYAEAYQNLGVIYYKLGKLPESLEAFTQAVDLYERSQRQEQADVLRQGLQEIGLGLLPTESL